MRDLGTFCTERAHTAGLSAAAHAQRLAIVSSPATSVRRMILTDAMAILYRSHFAFSDAHRLRTAGEQLMTVTSRLQHGLRPPVCCSPPIFFGQPVRIPL